MSEIHYGLAAGIFFVLIFFSDFLKKQLRTKRTRMFHVLLCFLMFATFFQLDTQISWYYGESDMLNRFLQTITIYVEMMSIFALHFYARAFHYNLKAYGSVIFDCIYMLVITITVLTSPWTKLCFGWDKKGIIYVTPLLKAFGILFLIYLIYDIVMLWVSYRKKSIRRKCAGTLFIFCFMCNVISLLFNVKQLRFMEVMMVLCTYIYYLTLQSPDFYVDDETGQYNRAGFIEMLREKTAYQEKYTCLLIRVRNYNSLNRIYGAEILKKIQWTLGQMLNENNPGKSIYHVGSSTYALILDSEEEARKIYHNMYEKIPVVWDVEGDVVNHEYSFYKVSYPKDGNDYEEIMQRIHYARSDHENHHKPGELISLEHRTVEENEQKKKVAHLIEEAIMDNSIELNFQPIYSIEKDRITSLEVLARLKDENKNYINPEYFIHVAEENHSIVKLGEQIYRKACIFASQNHIFDYGIEDMNINLSPAQCRFEGLSDILVNIAKEYDIPMKQLHLEITESEFKDEEAVEETLRMLKKTGAKVALDDFGTGYSTLSNVLELPVDYVKIDKSLVWSFAEGKNQFLDDLMPMIKNEGKKIIAEGIETQEHIDIIKRLQGDLLQGYYFSKPLQEEKFMQFLKEFNQI